MPRHGSNKFFIGGKLVEVRKTVQEEHERETYGFGLECLDGLDVLADVVRDGLKVA